MTDIAEITPTDRPAPRPNGVRREPTARTFELGAVINIALAGATYQQIADTILDPSAAEERRSPKRSTKADADAVRHLLASPEGQKALRYAINDLQEHTDRFLVSAHLSALRALVREMTEAPKPGDRIRAATAITALATKRVEISGPGGGPIDLNAAVLDVLDEKVALMRERSKAIIEAYGVPVVEVEIESTPSETPVLATIEARVAEILATIPTPTKVVEEPAPVTVSKVRHRQPAPIIRPQPRR